MEPVTDFVRDSEEEPSMGTVSSVIRLNGWEQVVFVLEDEPREPSTEGSERARSSPGPA